MKIGILGSGIVGQTLAASLAESGHEVTIGTRDVADTLARTESGPYGNPPFRVWHEQHPGVGLETFAGAARLSDIVINATVGAGSLEALRLAGEANLDGKILIDVSNPLDFSRGVPPSLLVSNTDSQGEQIQRAFPTARVVKTLNTVNASVMVNPGQVAGGDHTMFVCGNDAGARAEVAGYLKAWFGWKDVVDLGDLSAARGMEMLLPVWVRLWSVLQTPAFNFKLVR